jgi:CRP/FNR family cyclic AMP-dependent transcriptional regulator
MAGWRACCWKARSRRTALHYVPERWTQAEIASRVGCSREMVSRIFKDLAAGNYISVEPDRIVINREPPARW